VCVVETADLGTEKHTEVPRGSPARVGRPPSQYRSRSRLGSGREPFVAMMKAADLWECDNLASTRWAYGTRIGAVLCERQVGPGSMVIVEVGRQDPTQVTRVQDNDMIEALPPDRSDDALNIGVLPRRSWRRRQVDGAHRFQPIAEDRSIGCVAISDQVSRRGFPRERLHKLLRQPGRRRMGGDVEVNHLAPFMAQHDECIEQSKGSGRDDEQIDRGETVRMVGEEGPPGL